MSSNPLRIIGLAVITLCIWGICFTRDTKSLGNGHLVNFLPCGSQETRGWCLIVSQFTTYPNTLLSRLQRDVTLKIVKSAVSEDSKELSILNELSHSITPHAGKEHVISLLDHFEHEGPNGLHLCLVFPLMMSDGEAITIRGKARNVSFVRAVSTQIILGLDFLYQNNMIYGGNILDHNFNK